VEKKSKASNHQTTTSN